ncbi:uncharacterized protein LOC107763045 [Nicotiana tabacum]|uniref:Uncharacterized protein LOC107763045 n=1 Tax=Nicotiana tabacum TaxID=4097 RepID=A0A1S3XAV8_TOBAC
MNPSISFKALKWEDIYPSCLWHIWLNRNNNNINNISNGVSIITTLNKAAEFKYLTGYNHPPLNIITIPIRWQNPSRDSFKLNCDSAYTNNTNTGGLGGVIRNNNGKWIVGYQKLTNVISNTHAELLALETGLRVAVQFKLHPIEIETDSTKVISLFDKDHQIYDHLISSCRWLMTQLGTPLLRYSFREANSVAHLLAKDSKKLKSINKTIIHHTPTQPVEVALKDDAVGRQYFRLISEEVCNRLASMGNINAVQNSSTFVKSLSFDPNGIAGRVLCNVT